MKTWKMLRKLYETILLMKNEDKLQEFNNLKTEVILTLDLKNAVGAETQSQLPSLHQEKIRKLDFSTTIAIAMTVEHRQKHENISAIYMPKIHYQLKSQGLGIKSGGINREKNKMQSPLSC